MFCFLGGIFYQVLQKLNQKLKKAFVTFGLWILMQGKCLNFFSFGDRFQNFIFI
jgi:hypothetical protein